ncbi:MAG: c-type cytochrome [Candidatus Acidiferrales bacterium]
MLIRAGRNLVALSILFLSTLSFAAPQGKEDKKPPQPPLSDPVSGEGLYRMYCAVCHGKTGRGDGPAAIELKGPPPDLTTLTRRHGGEFPEAYVTDVLRNGVKTPAHGTSDMPIWGPLFGTVGGTDPAIVNKRITNLVNYIKSLQVK